MNYFLSFVILAEIFSIAALSTNLLIGVIGIFSVAQAAIMGVGAYTAALLMVAGVPFPLALLAAVVICAAINVLSSLPALRLAGDYFIITSFGTQLVATAVFINWQDLTGGATGLMGIPIAAIAGHSFASSRQFAILVTVFLILIAGSFWLLMRSPYGKLLHAIRLNEVAAVAAGRKVLRAKVGVAALSGAYAGVAGALYATYISFIDPVSFDIHVSVLVVTMLVVGGARTLAGSIIGPFLLLAIPQLLALVDIPSTIVGPVRQLVYGVILITFMLWRPQGIAGRKL
ncbi:branched-chain amino acid ABC transporter permease [Mesorhizobium sp.]|uniref:branched-chain amino acid ABC transporter permease n=1 Tax=Mesorhizobium sp. TaxID=1871066 RepID=UPI000FDA24C4|nr:branched-chain amino acid ABC transporter permease [Mesorhizobium sp.]RWD63465.1 MAG: branched-chain amino acid ABC transporter permease [Mesorhizobium sp.]RWE76278.1 MAG: branched-chain amino acid ABC transporter permease [Mesorhizobium sp.]TIV32335.1 MAG: branched-chain amino acid ABC transporter permease [Mesorhizobium sp.]TIV56834.1 MAG: branched-chain amino acid ABC transporter permease [Mesorhizobium sp.]